MTSDRRVKTGLAALGGVVVAALGAGAGVAFSASATPASLASAASVGSVPVTERQLTDPRTVEIALTVGGDTSVSSPASGLVTTWSCTAGSELVSGQGSLSVDGVQTLNMATTVPLWRDLELGTTGPDVTALQTELARLGQSVPVDGTVGSATLDATVDLFAIAGDPAPDRDVIRAARVLWLPGETVTVSTCDSSTGGVVSAGDPVATLTGRLTGAVVARLPVGAVPGARNLEIDGLTVPVGDEGRVTSPEALATISGSDSFLQAVRGAESSIQGRLALAEPVTVSSVPPGSLYDLDGQAACVLGDGIPTAVQVVGSELGQTFVTFETPTSPSLVALSPETGPACR